MGFNAKERLISGLLNVKGDDKLYESLTTLQNEIGVGFDMKVVAITSINSDALAAAFAKGFADTFVKNKSNCLIIDANMYNPSLESLLGESDLAIKDNSGSDNYQLLSLEKGLSAIYLNKEIYPSEVFKSGLIQQILEEHGKNYDHIVLLVPSIRDHKEIVLLKDVLQSIILVSQRNVTTKGDIYNACAYFVEESLPLAKTVILK